jgi:hypothetical protein
MDGVAYCRFLLRGCKAEAKERELAALQAELQELQRQIGSTVSESPEKGGAPVLAMLPP